jgi:uncharacterized protein (TIGR03000 family)
MRYLTFAAIAAALLIPNSAFAQKGGGHGGGGGGHGGGGGGGWHGGGGGGAWHGGSGTWHGGTTAWHGGTWNGGHWNGNWNGGHWNNWNGGHWHNGWWYPWVGLGLGYALGWGGWGWGWPYYYSSPSYYAYDYPTYYAYPSYAYPSTAYSDSYSRPSAYYDALASAAPTSPTISPYRAKLELMVPDSNAQIIVEGQRMDGLGSRRFFVSPDLDPGKNYSYTITMRSNNAGRPEEDTREVMVSAGMLKRIDFTQPVIRSLPAPRSSSGGIISTTKQPPPQAVPPK